MTILFQFAKGASIITICVGSILFLIVGGRRIVKRWPVATVAVSFSFAFLWCAMWIGSANVIYFYPLLLAVIAGMGTLFVTDDQAIKSLQGWLKNRRNHQKSLSDR